MTTETILNSKALALASVATSGVLLMIRLNDYDEAVKVSRAAIKGGIKAIEITLSTPGAFDIIHELSHDFTNDEDRVVVGAGTVLDPQSGYAAIQAGARMLVSPNYNPEMIRFGLRYQCVVISGALSPSEVVNTMESGADYVKMFPTSVATPEYLKTISAPLPWAPLMPSGGVTADNVDQWLNSGAALIGVGSYITKAARPDGDYERVTKAAQAVLNAVAAARA